MIFPDGSTQVRHGVPHPTAVRHLLSAQVSTQSLVSEAALLHEVGGWDETLTCWQDYELGFRLLRHAPQPALCEQVFHRIYRTADSITGHSLSANAPGIAAALCRLAEQVEKGVGFAFQTAPNAPEPVGFSPKTDVDASTLAQCRLALWLRVHIIAGQFCAEGASSAAASLLSATGAQSFFAGAQPFSNGMPVSAQGAQLRHVSSLDRAVARLLMAYTSRGGRGAWRFAALWTRLR